MRDDSNLTKPEREAAAATMPRVEPEDLTRLEGEGGRQVSEQRSEGEGTMKILAWKKVVARYQQPSLARGVWQIVNTLVPYAALWYLMYLSLAVSWWITVPLAMLAGGFFVWRCI